MLSYYGDEGLGATRQGDKTKETSPVKAYHWNSGVHYVDSKSGMNEP